MRFLPTARAVILFQQLGLLKDIKNSRAFLTNAWMFRERGCWKFVGITDAFSFINSFPRMASGHRNSSVHPALEV